MASPIYLDYNATTPADPAVVDVMLPWLRRPSNPSSAHRAGRAAAAALEVARGQVAQATGTPASSITFTSGATESINTALRTAVGAVPRRRIVATVIEHKAVLEPLAALADQGYEVRLLPVERDGQVDLAALDDALDEQVALVSVHLANNEIGTVQPLKAVVSAAHRVGALVHTDATQALGKIPVDLAQMGVDLGSFSSHKLYGPQGVGALYVRRGLPLVPLILGGGQERGRRPGTENTAGVVGFGHAAELMTRRLSDYTSRARLQTGLFLAEVQHNVAGVERTLPYKKRDLANTLSLRCQGVDGEALVAQCPGVAFSTGSACSSMVPESSHVLRALLGDTAAAAECVRISTGWPTTDEEIRDAARQFADAVQRIRQLAA